MQKAIPFALFALAMFSPIQLIWAEDSSSLIAQANAAYVKREDLPEAKIAMVLYERAAVTDSTHAIEGYWKASRSAWWLGENTTERDEQLILFQKAIDLAKKAVDLDPESVEAHFWLGANLGTYGKAKGVMKSLSLVKPIRHEMAEVIRLDDHYLNGAAYRVLGVVDFKVPGIMGGNLKRAKEELDKTHSMAPNDPFVYYDYVQYYQVTNDIPKAQAALQDLRNLQVASDMGPEQKMLIRKAEVLLRETH
jgi:tetratricopeptide (TPR) repeat protein